MKTNFDPRDDRPTQGKRAEVIDFSEARRKRRNADDERRSLSRPSESHIMRTRQNIVALALTALLVAVGAWMIVALRESLRTELCIESGRRNCSIVDLPK